MNALSTACRGDAAGVGGTGGAARRRTPLLLRCRAVLGSPRGRAGLNAAAGLAILAGIVAIAGGEPFIRGLASVTPGAIAAAATLTAIATWAAAWRWRLVAAGSGRAAPAVRRRRRLLPVAVPQYGAARRRDGRCAPRARPWRPGSAHSGCLARGRVGARGRAGGAAGARGGRAHRSGRVGVFERHRRRASGDPRRMRGRGTRRRVQQPRPPARRVGAHPRPRGVRSARHHRARRRRVGARHLVPRRDVRRRVLRGRASRPPRSASSQCRSSSCWQHPSPSPSEAGDHARAPRRGRSASSASERRTGSRPRRPMACSR